MKCFIIMAYLTQYRLQFYYPSLLIIFNLTIKEESMTVDMLRDFIFLISIITQVIIEILALSLAENGVIFCYNHLRRGDYSGRTNFQNNHLALCQCV